MCILWAISKSMASFYRQCKIVSGEELMVWLIEGQSHEDVFEEGANGVTPRDSYRHFVLLKGVITSILS